MYFVRKSITFIAGVLLLIVTAVLPMMFHYLHLYGPEIFRESYSRYCGGNITATYERWPGAMGVTSVLIMMITITIGIALIIWSFTSQDKQ